jgi:DNA-binding NarL/FixJ family response regulator
MQKKKKHAVARAKNRLSDRQLEAVTYCLSGLRNSEIASRMRITEYCVKYHLRGAYRALGIVSRYQLTRNMIGR